MSSQSAVDDSAFRAFQADLDRLVDTFGRNLADYKSNRYDEASLRQEFLNPFFRALGWDVENQAGQIPQHREVEIESRTDIGGRQKRADYLFRTDRIDRFICEAKKPADELQAAGAFQAKRYAWNKGLFLAVLTNFEEMRLYVVGSKPHPEELGVGLWKTWQFREYPLAAQEIWDLLSRSSVAGGALERVIDALPRKPTTKGKTRQQWLFKPDRSRALDTDFLNFLDEARRELASDLIRRNDRADLLGDNRLNEAVQRILDRLLFLRICEDRDIDTGRPLAQILRSWRDHAENPVPPKPRQSEFEVREPEAVYEARAVYPRRRVSLWREVVAHFQALDRRPPSHIPFFNASVSKRVTMKNTLPTPKSVLVLNAGVNAQVACGEIGGGAADAAERGDGDGQADRRAGVRTVRPDAGGDRAGGRSVGQVGRAFVPDRVGQEWPTYLGHAHDGKVGRAFLPDRSGRNA